jgi:hypothetical protein
MLLLGEYFLVNEVPRMEVLVFLVNLIFQFDDPKLLGH